MAHLVPVPNDIFNPADATFVSYKTQRLPPAFEKSVADAVSLIAEYSTIERVFASTISDLQPNS